MYLRTRARLVKVGDKLLERGMEYAATSFSAVELAQLRELQYCPGDGHEPAIEFYSESLAPRAKKHAEAAPAAG